MEQLASKLPLNLTDAAVEEIARPLGWHDSFMKPVSICLAKAPGSGDIGRMLQGGPKAAMPPASAKQTPVAVSATASPPPAPAKAPLPAHAKALTPAPILVPPVRATSGPPQPAAPGAPRVPPPPKQASHAAMPTVPSAQPSTPAVAPKAVQTLSKAMPVNPRASPDHVVPPANPPTIEPETVEHAAVEPVVAETPPEDPPAPDAAAGPPATPAAGTAQQDQQEIQAESEVIELPICLICQDGMDHTSVACFSSISSVDLCVVMTSFDNLSCQDTMDEGEQVLLQLHCGHWFHEDCVLRWAESTNSRPASRCPLRCFIPEPMDVDQGNRNGQEADHGFARSSRTLNPIQFLLEWQ